LPASCSDTGRAKIIVSDTRQTKAGKQKQRKAPWDWGPFKPNYEKFKYKNGCFAAAGREAPHGSSA